ncbi:MAG TPA: hypothetical protein VFZ97_14080 [Acidimicrobiales bacterium]
MDRASTHDLRDRDLRDQSTQLRKYSVELRSNAEELIKHVDAAMKRVHSRLAEKTAPRSDPDGADLEFGHVTYWILVETRG